MTERHVVDYHGQVALVTGGAGALGTALAAALAARGLRVALADRDAARLERAGRAVAAEGADVFPILFDVSDWAAWQNAVASVEDAFGPVAVLVNNAGVGGGSLLAEADPARWRAMIEVNTLGPFYGCRALIPKMLERGTPAHIVNIASLSGLRADAGMSAYCASKHAIVGMSDALRGELAPTNIGISIAYPGMVDTDFVAHSNAIAADDFGVGAPAFDPALNDILKSGMRPAAVAERVVSAMLAGDYHIHTHGDWKRVIANHFEDRLQAIGASADPDYHENVDHLLALFENQEPRSNHD